MHELYTFLVLQHVKIPTNDRLLKMYKMELEIFEIIGACNLVIAACLATDILVNTFQLYAIEVIFRMTETIQTKN